LGFEVKVIERRHRDESNIPESIEADGRVQARRRVKKLCAVKGVDIQRVRFPPGDGSLQPVAIREAEEVTISSKPLM
jgi:DNA/RNA endonuclease YhcR with UshA esterase domain